MRLERQANKGIGKLVLKKLGETDYVSCLTQMRTFTDERAVQTEDQLWLTSHPPVFTLGQAGKKEHLLRSSNIPVVQTDRGGQITYHGPGQQIAYILVDLRRKDYGVRSLVRRIEESTIATLAYFDLSGMRRAGMPGVYTQQGAKIAALGLRVRHGCTYHGISLNLDCDLAPYSLINPCGYSDLAVTSLKNEKISYKLTQLHEQWVTELEHAIFTTG